MTEKWTPMLTFSLLQAHINVIIFQTKKPNYRENKHRINTRTKG